MTRRWHSQRPAHNARLVNKAALSRYAQQSSTQQVCGNLYSCESWQLEGRWTAGTVVNSMHGRDNTDSCLQLNALELKVRLGFSSAGIQAVTKRNCLEAAILPAPCVILYRVAERSRLHACG